MLELKHTYCIPRRRYWYLEADNLGTETIDKITDYLIENQWLAESYAYYGGDNGGKDGYLIIELGSNEDEVIYRCEWIQKLMNITIK